MLLENPVAGVKLNGAGHADTSREDQFEKQLAAIEPHTQ
jgi:hypothetical protein